MKKEEIHWADWYRIFFGTAPLEFLLEALIRTVLIYMILLIVLRFLGKRMGGQLTISELAVMLTLGAIISVPMQVPDRGLLQGILVLCGALLFQRGITFLSVRYKKIELITEGEGAVLVKNGVLQVSRLRELRISRDQILAELRKENVYNLGEVRRMYLEACGLFSIIKYNQPRPGLAIIPEGDPEAETTFKHHEHMIVCKRCGESGKDVHGGNITCQICSTNQWVSAVTSQ